MAEFSEYRGVNGYPGHLLALEVFVLGAERNGEEQAFEKLRRAREIGGDIALLMSGVERDLPKALAHKGDNYFRVSRSVELPRCKITRPDLFREHLERKLTSEFSEIIDYYSKIYDISDCVLQRVELDGACATANEGEDCQSLSLRKQKERFKTRPLAEALEKYPDHKGFYVMYTLVLNSEAFKAWVTAHEKWSGQHMESVSRAERKL